MAHQTYMPELVSHVQTDMLAEFSGKDGHEEAIIDIEQYKRNHQRPDTRQIKLEEDNNGTQL